MAAPLISDLREPPVVGKFYQVPVIDYWYDGRRDLWPTLGPLHHDRGEVNFPHLHYHVDPRFLTAAQWRFIERGNKWNGADSDVLKVVAFKPLCHLARDLPKKPRLVRRKCRITQWAYSPPTPPRWGEALADRYGAPAEALRIKGDRLLCPHRKVDLSSLVPDKNGIVTCPLHGLRVRCANAAQVPA